MNLSKSLLLGVGLSLAIAGCGTQGSSMSSSSSSSAAPAAPGKVVLSNGKFQPAATTLSTGQQLTFVFDGMGSDHLDVLSGGKVIAHSPLLNQGGTWKYTFNSQGTYTVEPQTMTYIHATITVN
ncbi:MAG: hypothetical protein M0Z53_10545 [Thermaerobacter sp.]|nr:hypothetical protein [Thermaerobacter sp.]